MGLTRDFYRNLDVHLHIPEGAIPKDGPSAGITIATTICSALTKIPVRGDLAMTGEITLRGKVLPIGGLKEKLLAAHRHGINEVIIPKDNQKDLPDIPEYIRNLMKLHFVDHMDEVLRIALERELVALPSDAGRSRTRGAAGDRPRPLEHLVTDYASTPRYHDKILTPLNLKLFVASDDGASGCREAPGRRYASRSV